MFCSNCGEPITEKTKFCPYCGEPVNSEAEEHKVNEVLWESKTYTVRCVPPNFETTKEVIEKFEAFGWELYSSQEVNDKDVNVEVTRTEIRTTTTTEKSTYLVFRRNKKMPHYKEIVELEELYDNADLKCKAYMTAPAGSSIYVGVFSALAGIGLLTCTGLLRGLKKLSLLFFLIAIPCIVYNVVLYKKYKKDQDRVTANKAKYEPVKKDCLEKVWNYVQ